MGTKIFDRNSVLMNQTWFSLALMDTVLIKKTWMKESMEGMVLYVCTQKGLGDNDEGVQLEVKKNTLSSLFGKMMQVDIFEAVEGVVHQPQKNANNFVKRDGEIGFYNQVNC